MSDRTRDVVSRDSAGTAQSRVVTIDIEGQEPFVHRSTGPSDESAVDLAMQVLILSRGRSTLVGRKITATVEEGVRG